MNQADKGHSGARDLAVAASAPEKGGGRGKGLLGVLLFILLVLLGFGFFAVRTDGFRTFLEEEAEKRTKEKISIGKIRIGWPYDLVLEQVRTVDSGRGLLSIREIRVGVRPDLSGRVFVTGGRLSLAPAAEGGWTPRLMAPLGAMQQVEELSRAMANFDRRIRLDVHDSMVEWLDSDGRKTAFADGIDLVVTPIDLPARKMYHCMLGIRDVLRTNGARIRDVEREWICTEEQPYVEIGYKADWGNGADIDDVWIRTRKQAKKDDGR